MNNTQLLTLYFEWIENCLENKCAAQAAQILMALVRLLKRFVEINYRPIVDVIDFKNWRKEHSQIDAMLKQNEQSQQLFTTLLSLLLIQENILIPDDSDGAQQVAKMLLTLTVRQIKNTKNPIIAGIDNTKIADVLSGTLNLRNWVPLSYIKGFAFKLLSSISTLDLPKIPLLSIHLSDYFQQLKFDFVQDSELTNAIQKLETHMMRLFSNDILHVTEKVVLKAALKDEKLAQNISSDNDFLVRINQALGKKFMVAVAEKKLYWDFSDDQNPYERYIMLKGQCFKFSEDAQERLSQQKSILKRLNKIGISADNVQFVYNPGKKNWQLRITQVAKLIQAHVLARITSLNKP